MPYRQARSPWALHEYFWTHVDDSGDCWLWLGPRSGDYGRSSYASPLGTYSAHRLAWELKVGPIAPGLVLDHLCCNPLCVNPAHLEPVTVGENSRRGDRGQWRRAPSQLVINPPVKGDGKLHTPRLDAARRRDQQERRERKFSTEMQRWWEEMIARLSTYPTH